jgi:hypothetical protein
VATGDAPVLEALIDINAVSLARAELDPATLLLVRIAALAAVDAPAASYLMHLRPMMESGVKVDQVQDVLVDVAPITGAPRVLSAATRSLRPLASPSLWPRWRLRPRRQRSDPTAAEPVLPRGGTGRPHAAARVGGHCSSGWGFGKLLAHHSEGGARRRPGRPRARGELPCRGIGSPTDHGMAGRATRGHCGVGPRRRAGARTRRSGRRDGIDEDEDHDGADAWFDDQQRVDLGGPGTP